MKQSFAIIFLALFSITLFAEEDPKPKKKPYRKDAINVYMDGKIKEGQNSMERFGSTIVALLWQF